MLLVQAQAPAVVDGSERQDLLLMDYVLNTTTQHDPPMMMRELVLFTCKRLRDYPLIEGPLPAEKDEEEQEGGDRKQGGWKKLLFR